jgi:hypothetical protein
LVTCGAVCELATAAAHAGETPLQVAGTDVASTQRTARVQAHSETYLRLFQRALLPGPNGAIVDTRTEAPIYEYLSVRARNVATPWQAGDLAIEVSGWGALSWGEPPPREIDADLTSAFVHQRLGPAYLRLGRQSVSTAAAPYVRLDGLAAGARSELGLGIDAYAGWSVLPRWDARPGYQHLGSAADSLVRDPEAIESLDRSGHWTAGARAHFESGSDLVAGLSFHEQREGNELARRNLGFDVRVIPSSIWSASGTASIDTDSSTIGDARLWVDVAPARGLHAVAEYLHTDPAILLSRQSVLAVFGGAAIEELGASLSWQPLRHLAISAGGYLQFSEEEDGLRTDAKLRATLDAAERWRLQLNHARLLSIDNGYHALRSSLGYGITGSLEGRVELYAYLYDEPIASRRHSLVQSANLIYSGDPAWSLLWGASLVQSPYADSDLQTLVRLKYQLGAR